MLNYKQAQELLASHASSFGKEDVQLEDAFGRVLAESVCADRDYPPFNRSAMDGYALNHNDVQNGILKYKIAQTIYAGQINTKTISSGQCYKIMTGAAVPQDADAVIRKEDTKEADGRVELLSDNCRVFQNIAQRGEDLREGQTVIEAPCVCTPSVISLLAALGKSAITVQQLPSTALFTTGNEVVDSTQPVSPVQIRNSNVWLLRALLAKWKIRPGIVAHLADDPDQLLDALGKAMHVDLIIISGGVSAGDADYVPAVLEKLNVQRLFHKVAIKPGKPIWCGKGQQGTLVMALPGNPFSCLVTFTLFIQFFLKQCFQLPKSPNPFWRLDGTRIKKSNLDEFFPVKVKQDTAVMIPLHFNGSGDIRAGLHADGLGIHPAEIQELRQDSPIEFLGFNTFY